MFFNRECKPPRKDLFVSMLSNLIMNEEFCSQGKTIEDSIISTNDFAKQVLILLQDVFNADIRLDENYVVSLAFSDNEKFKIRIIKE